eukprot:2418195-Pyramimonas_sp.AAC.1
MEETQMREWSPVGLPARGVVTLKAASGDLDDAARQIKYEYERVRALSSLLSSACSFMMDVGATIVRRRLLASSV